MVASAVKPHLGLTLLCPLEWRIGRLMYRPLCSPETEEELTEVLLWGLRGVIPHWLVQKCIWEFTWRLAMHSRPLYFAFVLQISTADDRHHFFYPGEFRQFTLLSKHCVEWARPRMKLVTRRSVEALRRQAALSEGLLTLLSQLVSDDEATESDC